MSEEKALRRNGGRSPPGSKRQLAGLRLGNSMDRSLQMESGQGSPRGPLSVDLSESGTQGSLGMENELARTFDLQELDPDSNNE